MSGQARRVHKRTIQRRLCDAGLAWLRRRRKSFVPTAHKAARVTFEKWVLRRRRATLGHWVYSEGTAFYLARDSGEVEYRKYPALGPMV